MYPTPKATMQDIGDALGLSRATVSNALLGKGRLSEKTRQSVHAKAAELGYVPSNLGRALRTGRSQVVGLVLPDYRMPLFAEFARAFAMAARARGMVLMVADSLGDPAIQAENLADLSARGVDALVLVPMRGSQLADLPSGEPLIVVDAQTHPLNAVASDHEGGGRLVAEHLAALGHREVLVLHASGEADGRAGSRVNDLRLAGLRHGFAAHGVGVREVVLDARFEAARDHLLAFAPGPVTAIAATYDTLAVGALMALHGRGIRVPEDISLAGFDDTVWSRIVSPPLTTVSQDLKTVAEEALAHAMGERAIPGLVPVSLVVRGSTAAPPFIHPCNPKDPP